MIAVSIRYPYDERILKLFAAESKEFPRAKFDMSREHDDMVFSIQAQDLTALRACVTTITKVLSVWETTKAHEQRRASDG